MTINASQIRAARALLNWSQTELCKQSGLGITTIRKLEGGNRNHNTETGNLVRETLEKAGIEFISPNGVRQKDGLIGYIEGADSCERLFKEITRTVLEEGGDVYFEFRSSKLMSWIASNKKGDFARLAQLGRTAPVKCLVVDTDNLANEIPGVETRLIGKLNFGTLSFVAYGRKLAMILIEPNSLIKFVVFDWPGFADFHSEHFKMHWSDAPLAFGKTKQTASKAYRNNDDYELAATA